MIFGKKDPLKELEKDIRNTPELDSYKTTESLCGKGYLKEIYNDSKGRNEYAMTDKFHYGPIDKNLTFDERFALASAGLKEVINLLDVAWNTSSSIEDKIKSVYAVSKLVERANQFYNMDIVVSVMLGINPKK